ncbi:conserved hypothetical protein [Leishmania braziliensis MHOM/BR/75/M2904]|uniref:Uncharacterized protein n=2 Tax=Leishmania braziliensis TaxID=5660 RepID=A4HLV7_LEIBR|nr:conserved hypothetical protein [Leishmania braziliensis MHOM/BR/75/M2904]CAJ2479632.1 unnamed protein product [Leishmania braziliensis]CAM40804.2 conserved hypothetical protein [Leishmania braziliensis MHOM/BR/75/M2904]SYZ69215.1 hypothetical_protein [Leishmania braziliensis MHOM/BR/75/M2904]
MTLVPHTQELQQEVETLQQLRHGLHDAYIVEPKVGQGIVKDVTAVEAHRTVDAHTLSVLKSPNYPFILCEEAPPSYVPPPVPYNVEGEIDSLKQRVLQVQEDLQCYQKHHGRGDTPLSASQVLDFFAHNRTYAEVAWEVSSLKWFYRWVLSHSISHLWNCKEQLEYVLTEDDKGLPQTTEEMDACLQAHPFADAVSLLDSERQAVVAQERRRLRSVSRIFRENVPAIAVTAATSCYLTSEEKYMYQEFFNQSEHMMLLLNHTLMLNKANSAHTMTLKSGPDSTSCGLLSNQQSSAQSCLQDSGALFPRSESAVSVMDTASLTKETLHAVSAEQDMIKALMNTIRERQQRGECFGVSAAERERIRAAQIAVYGCVLSDMSLMSHQMNLVAEFMEHYDSWLKLRGYDTHDQLMIALSKRSGGIGWPMLSTHDQYGTEGRHSHFVPPTEEMMRYYRPLEKVPSESVGLRSNTSAREASKPFVRNLGAPGCDLNNSAAFPSVTGAAAPARAAAANTVGQHVDLSSPPGPLAARQVTGNDVANAFYALLIHANEAVCNGSATTAEKGGGVDRAWLTACVRYTLVKLLRHDWSAADVAKGMLSAEEALLALVNRKRAFSRMRSTTAALCAVVQEVARLCSIRNAQRSSSAEVPVAVHMPDSVDNAKIVADVTNPVEQQRWGSVVDAIWFQVDPSAASSGGLLFHATAVDGEETGPVPCNKQSAAHFLYIESIGMPLHAVTSGVTFITMHYRLPRMSAAAETSRCESPTLATMSDAQPARGGSFSRYHLARRALAALFEVEARGLLPCFACRVSEVSAVPLAQMVYVAFDDGNASSVVDKNHVPHLCILPPAAMELKRMDAKVGVAPAPTRPTEALYAAYAEPVSFCSIGLLVGGLLEGIAARTPTLHDLYMTAETVLEQAAYEIKCGATPKAFVNASTHPTPTACAPTKTRAMSIQRESVINHNSVLIQRFISPLLRHMDDRISSLEFGEGVGNAFDGPNSASPSTQASVLTLRGSAVPELSSVAGRRTEMIDCAGTISPSPSAVRPSRR